MWGPRASPNVLHLLLPISRSLIEVVKRDFYFENLHRLVTASILSVYRVIKNQPPPILSIELDHNPFKCPAAGCTKSFRKASLLHYHIKYYHSDHQAEACVGEEPPR